jgi:chromosome transmission fidelity protein 1
MDAISNIHSVTITQAQLKRCRAQLGIYLQKFRNRLKGKNRVYVTQVVRLLDSLSGFLEEKGSSRRESEGAVNVTDLMSGKGVDQINLYKLMRYLVDSKLARKVEGYIAHTEEHGPVAPSKLHMSISPVLTHVQSFLQVLTNPASEGRFFYEKSDSGDVSLKYMLLDPTHHFKGVVEEARAVILAGGTMSPVRP